MSLLRHTTFNLAPRARVPLTPHGLRNSSRVLTNGSYTGRRNLTIGAAMGDAVRLTTDTLTWVHSTAGVPWYIAIPLLAVGVNFTFRLPLQYYVARIRSRRTQLNPLVHAWARRHMQSFSSQGPEVPDRIKKLRIAGSVEKSRRRIYKTWGVQRWKGMAPLLGMFPFITISEALRRKCGAPLGWISHSMGLGNVEGVESNLGTASALFDQSFVDGGCLWFTNLTAMDPYFGLPLLCTAILGWSTWGKTTRPVLTELLSLRSEPGKVVAMTNLQKALGRTMLLVPIFPLLFSDLPSAIFLYWASSFALTQVNEMILSRLVPKQEPKLKESIRPRGEKPWLQE